MAIELPTGPNGARRRLRRGGYRTRTEAHRALTEMRTPHPADPHRALLTTGQWLRHWLATRLDPGPPRCVATASTFTSISCRTSVGSCYTS